MRVMNSRAGATRENAELFLAAGRRILLQETVSTVCHHTVARRWQEPFSLSGLLVNLNARSFGEVLYATSP